MIKGESGVQDSRLQSQRTEAFLSLARFSDAQYQSIDKYMNSSEFENKQALLKKAKEEVDLIRERKVTSNRSVNCVNTKRLGDFTWLNRQMCRQKSQQVLILLALPHDLTGTQ